MRIRLLVILLTTLILNISAIANEIKIATWNIQQLGQTKAGLKGGRHVTNDTIGKIATIIIKGDFDIIAIQEVQDKARKTLPKLLERLGTNYRAIQSKGVGRIKKEQYAVFYKSSKIKARTSIRIYNDMEDASDNFSRDPGYAVFSSALGFNFVLIICHLDPSQHAGYEVDRLDDVYEIVRQETKNENIFIVGDFNLKDGPNDIAFRDTGLLNWRKYPNLKAVLDATEDTTVAGKNDQTTYDNIIFHTKQFRMINKGVYRFDDEFGTDYDKKISDHYPVWAIFKNTNLLYK